MTSGSVWRPVPVSPLGTVQTGRSPPRRESRWSRHRLMVVEAQVQITSQIIMGFFSVAAILSPTDAFGIEKFWLAALGCVDDDNAVVQCSRQRL
jgi:hypothetical protein